jgi:transposase-like protein
MPYAMWTQVRIHCPQCLRYEVVSRARVFVGSTHRCPSCGRTYTVNRSYSLLGPGVKTEGGKKC